MTAHRLLEWREPHALLEFHPAPSFACFLDEFARACEEQMAAADAWHDLLVEELLLAGCQEASK